MKKLIKFITLISYAIIISVFTNVAITGEPKPLEATEMRKTGTIQVVKDRNDKVIAINLVVTGYSIYMDDNSKSLKKMNGEKVRLTVKLMQEDGKRVLVVTEVEKQ